MDAHERALLAETVRAALDGATDADGVLAELGWIDMLAAVPGDAIGIVFETLGRVHARSSAIDDVVLHALGLPPRPGLAVVLPPFGALAVEGNGGLATERALASTELVVGRDGGTGTVRTADVVIEPVHGVDPDAGLHRVRFPAAGVSPVRGAGRWSDAVALAQRALAHELAGASRAMLELARTHALGRVQFGRPVARFQAVRHRLADALVAVEALDGVLTAAAGAPNRQTAQLAKAAAGHTARIVAAHGQQVLAGVGFTTDHPFHRYLKRTIVLDGLFGSSDDLVAAIGHELLAARAVPTLIEL
jgi:alkylation response protein AidB-like acyl-CoA dehydrogenase